MDAGEKVRRAHQVPTLQTGPAGKRQFCNLYLSTNLSSLFAFRKDGWAGPAVDRALLSLLVLAPAYVETLQVMFNLDWCKDSNSHWSNSRHRPKHTAPQAHCKKTEGKGEKIFD